MSIGIALLAISGALGATARPAVGGVDVELVNGTTLSGTIAPEDASDVLRVRVPRGARLQVRAKRVKIKGAPPPGVHLQVLAPDGVDAAAGLVKAKGTHAKVKIKSLSATAEYRIVVTGDGQSTGDYSVTVKWKSVRRFSGDVDLAPGSAAFSFGADRGATAKISVKAVKRSPALPRLTGLVSDGFHFTGFTPPPDPEARRHQQRGVELADSGDYVLTVEDAGGAGGAARVSVNLKPPKVRKSVVSVRGLGSEGADDAEAIGRVVTPAGGRVEAGAASGSIVGAAVDVPAGGLSLPTTLVIGTALDIAMVPGLPELVAVGPTVFFGPEGLSFDVAATVTIPFDPSGFGGDFSLLRVVQRNADGSEEIVPPALYSVNAAARSVSFSVSHFTSFRTFGLGGVGQTVRGDLNGDGVGDLIVATYARDTADANSVSVFFGRSDFFVTQPPATSADADAVFSVAGVDHRFAVAVETADVSGDGIEDLIVSDTLAAAGVGHVYVFFGGPGFSGSTTPEFDADVVLAGTLRFGWALAAGQLVGDDTPDLVVSEKENASERGHVEIYVGGSGLATGVAPLKEFTGPLNADLLGKQLAVADVSGDGVPDLVCTAPKRITFQPKRVRVFLGGPDFAAPTHIAADITLTGEPLGRTDLGMYRLSVGDATGDGVADIAVTDVEPFPGGTTFVVPGGSGLATGNLKAAAILISVDAADTHFDVSNVVLGDVDGDDVADVLEQLAIGFGTTAIRIHRGGSGLSTRTSAEYDAEVAESPGATSNWFGEQVRLVDVNDDGRDDLVITSWDDDRGGTDAGAVFVYLGGASLPGTGDADVVIVGDAAGREFGRAQPPWVN